jgi:hypothetical protein
MKRLAAGIVLSVLVGAMPAGAQSDPNAEHAISGVVTIQSGFGKAKAVRNADQTCSGKGLRSDLHVGAPVYVHANSAIVATVNLEAGRVTHLVKRGRKAKFDCKFNFHTGPLPVSDSFGFGFGERWGGPSITRSQIEAAGWVVEITV